MEEMLFHNEMLMYAMDQALEMVFLFDETGRITFANETAKRILEYGDALCGTMVTEIFPYEFRIVDLGFETNHDFTPDIISLMAYRRNHTCFAVEARILKYGYAPHWFICMAYDATRQNLYEKKAVQAGREKEEALEVKTRFVENITHELRTPVNGILGNARELVLLKDSEEQQRLLQLVERSCQDMYAIIDNVLDFSTLEEGKYQLENEKFQFRHMIDDVKSSWLHKITEKNLDFFMTVSPEVPAYVIGDEQRIRRILNILLDNAVKFTSTGKIVLEVVQTAQIDGRAELFFMVIDTGIGIGRADQDKLFKSFSQIEPSATRRYGGAGLGLNIAKQLVELMDGSIRVESEEGKGSMFSFHIWLELPREEDLSEAAPFLAEEDRLKGLGDAVLRDERSEPAGAEILPELEKKMSKLILSVEMDNWEKAELFMNAVKQLTDGQPHVKSAVLRLKMAIQKADHDKSVAAFEKLQEALQE